MVAGLQGLLIRGHLRRISKKLRDRSTDHLDLLQRERRLRALEELDRYRLTRPLPRNTYVPHRTPVFVDEHGRRCAVAHLIEASGSAAIVARTRRGRNLARVPDIEDPELLAWASDHGLTVDELAQIQPSYDHVDYDSARTLVMMVSLSVLGIGVLVTGFIKRSSIALIRRDARNRRARRHARTP